MENLVTYSQFENIYKDKRVLITGHTGFKGSWLALWLTKLGAKVCGYSLSPPTKPNQFELLNLEIQSVIGDIRNQSLLEQTVKTFKPEIVFHMAAQPLVRLSYHDPIETFETNVIGSLKVYEACKKVDSVRAIISITTDKVYENLEVKRGYTEEDRLGGKDPYSASKAAMEVMTQSYIHSFFNPNKLAEHGVLLSTVRAGNVIGGGDWAQDRLIPDIVRAAIEDKAVEIRSPYSVRPWQHVLDPLSGYLSLGQKLLSGQQDLARPYNFGPPESDVLTVKEVVESSKDYWSKINYKVHEPKEKLHEANLLVLNCDKVKKDLGWSGLLSSQESLKLTIDWYKSFYQQQKVSSEENLDYYIKCAAKKNVNWLKAH